MATIPDPELIQSADVSRKARRVSADGRKLVTDALPTASGAYRGFFALLRGATGTEDELHICLQDDSSPTAGYDWHQVSPAAAASSLVYFDCYESAATTFTDSPTQVALDTVRKNSDATVFSLASNEVTVDKTGTFAITIQFGADVDTGTARTTSHGYLEQDTGGGYAEVTGTRCGAYHRYASSSIGETSYGRRLIMDLTSGDKLKLTIVENYNSANTMKTLANWCGLTIEEK